MTEKYPSTEEMFCHAVQSARDILSLEKGMTVVLTGGRINGASGNTNTIRLESVR